jgi:ketol-acid reductoisomerase
MRVYHDQDADLGVLQGRRIAVIGYGNQGRAQALNLRDSGQDVLVGNREDAYAERAREDGFSVLPIERAVAQADIVMLLIPDEVAPGVFEAEIAPHLSERNALVFASGYNIAFDFIAPPRFVDVVLVAPRMIGAGVRDLYLAGSGFPSFIGVAQDYSGQAKGIALALAKGIGSTRAGVIEVTFAQEAELDLFTEQCFGPAFGHVLTTSVNLLLDEGYPPEAVLLELYMSRELSYTLGKIAELGLVDQTALHSRTSQYGSMSRGMRFILPDLRTKMLEGLEEIRSGRFAQEWAAEQAAGCPTLEALKEAALSLPLRQVEQELRQALKSFPASQQMYVGRELERGEAVSPTAEPAPVVTAPEGGFLRRLWDSLCGKASRPSSLAPLSGAQMEEALRRFVTNAAGDPDLRDFSRGREMTTHYLLHDPELEFYMRFQDGQVTADLGPPPSPAEVRLETTADVLDGMFTGRINAMRAAMTGRLSFDGDAKLAISVQQIQDDLRRLYTQAREEVAADQP